MLQQMLEMLPSWPNALSAAAEDVYSLEFSEVAEILRRILLVLTECEDLYYTL
jgi:predicted ATPase